MKKERLSLRIPAYLGEWLDLFAYEAEKTKAETIIDILLDYYTQKTKAGKPHP